MESSQSAIGFEDGFRINLNEWKGAKKSVSLKERRGGAFRQQLADGTRLLVQKSVLQAFGPLAFCG
jgi:hypothetical protein